MNSRPGGSLTTTSSLLFAQCLFEISAHTDVVQILLRNRLKYALTGREVLSITQQRIIKVDNKVRTDPTFPTGFMDVVSIEKSGAVSYTHLTLPTTPYV